MVVALGPAAAAFLRTEPGAAAPAVVAARAGAARPLVDVAAVRERADVSAGGLVGMTVLLIFKAYRGYGVGLQRH
ncbi:hypothetical protein WG31_02350 [Acetobacter oryzifermentans]|uniref:Uncharacterized protein n=1 Tax=Acetobacter oryzifermentans TaxID=1633874 RepID=A0ABM6AH71_9PROT|nr:hypothetical protein WG31_02350 [Acetobacter oryzifermentans]